MDDAMQAICAGAAKELADLITKRARVPELALCAEDRATAIRYYDQQIALTARFLARRSAPASVGLARSRDR
jgi:hypothetical protein